MPNLTAFALDAGNAQIKSCAPTGKIQEDTFPHSMAALGEGEYRAIASRTAKPDPDYFIVNGTPYVIGDKAKRKGVFKRKTGAARYTSEYYGIFAAIAMTRLFQRSVDKIFLIGSHAPKDAAYANDLMSAVCKTWKVEWQGKDYTFKVYDSVTIDEPLGGWSNTILRKDGRGYADKQINDGVTLVLDIGAFTTDGVIIDPGGAIDYSTAKSEVVGVQGAVENFARDLRLNNADVFKKVHTIDESKIHQAIRTGLFDARGLGQIDCIQLADEVCNALVSDIVNFYESFGGAANFDTVVLTGGGSGLLEARLRQNIDHNNIILADESVKIHLANARGMIKWYRMHEALGTFA